MFSIMAGPSKRGMELPSPQHAEEEKGAAASAPFCFQRGCRFLPVGGVAALPLLPSAHGRSCLSVHVASMS